MISCFFVDEENIVTFLAFGCGITLYPQARREVKLIKREHKNILGSCENSNCIRSNDPASPLSLNHTPDTRLLTIKYRQTSDYRPKTEIHPIFSSLRPADSNKKGLRVSFAFFQRNYLPDGRVNKTVATVQELILKLGVLDEVPSFVINCNDN